MNSNSIDHRFFLKGPSMPNSLGEFIPEKVRVNRHDEVADLCFLKQNNSILFFASYHCEYCNIEPVIEALMQYKGLQSVIFYECFDDDAFNEFQLRIGDSSEIIRCEMSVVHEQLNYSIIPLVIAMNTSFQIVGEGHFHDLASIERRIRPILTVMKTMP